MRPLLHPTLVNERSGDPALYVETLFEKRAILFDLGDISSLSPRDVLRVGHVFVSHAHIDHFVGFDRLLRLSVGREKEIGLVGPTGLIDQVGHKLHAYVWNLAPSYACDLVFVVTEADAALAVARAHLTTTAAGDIARTAGVRRVEPFHFSARYAGEDARMLAEVTEAFAE